MVGAALGSISQAAVLPPRLGVRFPVGNFRSPHPAGPYESCVCGAWAVGFLERRGGPLGALGLISKRVVVVYTDSPLFQPSGCIPALIRNLER